MDKITGNDMNLLVKAMNSGRTEVEKTMIEEKVKGLNSKFNRMLGELGNKIKGYEF